jgi:hypothetical protein
LCFLNYGAFFAAARLGFSSRQRSFPRALLAIGIDRDKLNAKVPLAPSEAKLQKKKKEKAGQPTPLFLPKRSLRAKGAFS